MTNPSDLQNLIGSNAVDSEGNKIGKVGQVYLDDQTGQPEWVTVNTGLFGTKQSFVPLQGYSMSGDDLVLSVSKDVVKDAPNIDDDGHLEESEESTLYDYYSRYLGTGAGTGYASGRTDTEYATRTDTDVSDSGTVGRDTSGPETDDAMTRSEERLNVGTQRVETGRARLRKYIVTENVTQTVPVSREEVRIEREPITDANRDAAYSGGDLTEEEHEVTLHAERPVVEKETVPVERVRLDKDVVSDQQTVNEEVRKEQIDVDGGTTTTDATTDRR